jgi:hypothetical protein
MYVGERRSMAFVPVWRHALAELFFLPVVLRVALESQRNHLSCYHEVHA